MSIKRIILSAFLAAAVISCKHVSFTETDELPLIIPDCAGVTVPEGMPPLVFEMADGSPFKLELRRVADTVYYHVRAWNPRTGKGVRYAPFPVYVSQDPIDP
ncbi:MAG: hypothetical protein J5533_08425, partial [Bacteroidales bacterium]|nr:hypothetical protein [Bacteroidales bacterium]